jgi:uncharacterized protein YoxC
MIPLAQAVVVICVAVVSVVLIVTLLTLRRTALRAESVMQQVERDLRPMVGQLESLTAEVTELSRNANLEMKRVGVVVGRVDDISGRVSSLLAGLFAMTRYGQYAALIGGLKRGLDVFVGRLKERP